MKRNDYMCYCVDYLNQVELLKLCTWISYFDKSLDEKLLFLWPQTLLAYNHCPVKIFDIQPNIRSFDIILSFKIEVLKFISFIHATKYAFHFLNFLSLSFYHHYHSKFFCFLK